MENRRKATMTGILDIDSFNEQGIIALSDIGIVIVKGSNIRVSKLNVESGDVTVEGDIDSITYTDVHDKKAGSVIKGIFR